MFHACLSFLHNELNHYIQDRANTTEDMVSLVLPQTFHDLSSPAIQNKVVMSLVDIHREEANSHQAYIPQGKGFMTKNPPIIFSMKVLFAAHFDAQHTLNGLQHLALVIACFQAKHFFTAKDTPALQAHQLDNISVELLNLDEEAKQALWNRLRVPYMPSVFYNVGNVAIEDMHTPGTMVPEIRDVIIK